MLSDLGFKFFNLFEWVVSFVYIFGTPFQDLTCNFIVTDKYFVSWLDSKPRPDMTTYAVRYSRCKGTECPVVSSGIRQYSNITHTHTYIYETKLRFHIWLLDYLNKISYNSIDCKTKNKSGYDDMPVVLRKRPLISVSSTAIAWWFTEKLKSYNISNYKSEKHNHLQKVITLTPYGPTSSWWL